MKQIYEIKRFLCSKAATQKVPITGTFELTGRCNFRCKMCYVRQTEEEVKASGGEIKKEQWLNLAKEAKKAGLVFLLLTGGEPLLREDFPWLYENLTNLGLSISINTNGSLLTEEIRQLFTKYPPALVNVTLYGADEKGYENLCLNSAAFHKVLENMRWLKALGISVNVNTTVTPWNISQLPAIRKLAQKEGFTLRLTAYNFPPARRDNAEDFDRLPPETVGQLLAEDLNLRYGKEYIKSLCEKIEAEEALPPLCTLEAGEEIECLAGKSLFWVNWQGLMTPCGMLNSPCTNPFEEGFFPAWHKLTQLTESIRLCADCNSCKNKSVCTNCAAVTYAETGAFNGKPPYMCQVTEAYIEALKKLSVS